LGHVTRVIAEAKKRFDAWASGDKSAIHANLRSPIFRINITEGGKREYDILQQECQTADSIDGREICIASLARTKDAQLIKDYCEFLFSGKVPTQDIHTGAANLAANSKARGLLWEFVKANYNRIEERLSINKVVFERFLRMGLSKFADHATEKDIAQFFKDKDQGGIDRALIIVGDTIRTNANYVQRDEKRLLEWLKAHGYA
jgi:Ras-related protein Rab-1A